MPRNGGRRALFRALYGLMMVTGATTLVFHIALALFAGAKNEGPHVFLTHENWCAGQQRLLTREVNEQLRALATGARPRISTVQRIDKQIDDAALACRQQSAPVRDALAALRDTRNELRAHALSLYAAAR